MLLGHPVVRVVSLSLTLLCITMASGEDYPNKPVRIVTAAAGGGTDFQTRLIAQALSTTLGQQMIVDNRPVYTSMALIVSTAPPDGYTLLSAGSSIWTLPLLQKTPYDAAKDFAPISLIARSINVLVVHPSLAVNSVKDLIALAKANPRKYNYASGGTGAPGHLTGELFKSMAGVDMVHVLFKGGAAAVGNLIAGQVQLTFDNPSTVMPIAKAGKLKALAVTSAKQSPLVPGLPAISETLPGFESVQSSGILAPAKTPPAIIHRLNEAIVRVLNEPDLKEKFFNRSIEVVYSSPEEFGATRKTDTARWAKVVKDAGIKAD